MTANTKGIFFALAAALLNATIGFMSKILMQSGLPASSVAFLKSAIGAVVLFMVLCRVKHKAPAWITAFACAFLGIFMLFFFETLAYRYELAANVVLMLMASASLSAFLLGWWLLGDAPVLNQWLGLLLCCLGLAFLLGVSSPSHLLGLFFAACAGLGYGAFSVFAKKLELGGGLVVTKQLLLCGSLYLAVPFAFDGAVLPALSVGVVVALVFLALLPSIGGFYCTTKAIELTTPARVQLAELSEPLFAAVIAAMTLGEEPTTVTYAGGTLVLCGLLLAQRSEKTKGRENVLVAAGDI